MTSFYMKRNTGMKWVKHGGRCITLSFNTAVGVTFDTIISVTFQCY